MNTNDNNNLQSVKYHTLKNSHHTGTSENVQAIKGVEENIEDFN